MQKNKTPVKGGGIKWHHTRWFWGVVVAIYAIPIIWLEVKVTKLNQNIFFALPRGFTESIYAIFNIHAKKILPDFYKYNPSTGYTIYLYLVSLLFYIILAFLVYKVFKQKRVKIKLTLILIILLSLSIFGLSIYFLLRSFTS